jgi:hypothetical protein
MTTLIAAFLLAYFEAEWGWWVCFWLILLLEIYGSVK